MDQWCDITSRVIEQRMGDMYSDMVVLASCPVCEQSVYIHLQLTDDVFTWECTYCKSKIESTIAAKKAIERSE